MHKDSIVDRSLKSRNTKFKVSSKKQEAYDSERHRKSGRAETYATHPTDLSRMDRQYAKLFKWRAGRSNQSVAMLKNLLDSHLLAYKWIGELTGSWYVSNSLTCWSQRAWALMSAILMPPLLQLYANRWQCWGWKSAQVITCKAKCIFCVTKIHYCCKPKLSQLNPALAPQGYTRIVSLQHRDHE